MQRARPATLFKKEVLAQVFSCEFCDISKNTFLYRTPLVGASVASLSHFVQDFRIKYFSCYSHISRNISNTYSWDTKRFSPGTFISLLYTTVKPGSLE